MCGREQLISQGGVACSSDITLCDLEEIAAKSNINISGLMSAAYRAIGDPDGIYGCSTDGHKSTVSRSVKAQNDCLVDGNWVATVRL